MSADSNIPSDILTALKRYQEIQKLEQELHEEKSRLQDLLGRHMADLRLEQWYPEVEGTRLKARCTEETVVEYDEHKLQERLGQRFASLLAPDPKKIRQCLPQLAELLAPVMDRVGSPSPEKVKAALTAGLVNTDEFKGAFTKTTRRRFSLGRVRTQQDSTMENPESE